MKLGKVSNQPIKTKECLIQSTQFLIDLNVNYLERWWLLTINHTVE